MNAHFTATVYIVREQKILLIFHKKLQKWLPPGGHLDPNETPANGAKREAYEETGLEIEFITHENVWINRWNAKSIPRPYLCLLEEIPPHGEDQAHQHIDMIYLAKPCGGEERKNGDETEGLHWFTLDEIEQLGSDTEIFEETKQTIRGILTSH